MKSTIHKCVRNVKAVPNPTQYTKFDKHTVKNKYIEIGPKLVRSRFRVYFCYSPVVAPCGLMLPAGAMQGGADSWHVRQRATSRAGERFPALAG